MIRSVPALCTYEVGSNWQCGKRSRFYEDGDRFTFIKTWRHDRQRWQALVSHHIAEYMMCRKWESLLRAARDAVVGDQSNARLAHGNSNRVEMWDACFLIHRVYFTIMIIMDLFQSLFNSDRSNFSFDTWARYFWCFIQRIYSNFKDERMINIFLYSRSSPLVIWRRWIEKYNGLTSR